jgi:hypothetical protein
VFISTCEIERELLTAFVSALYSCHIRQRLEQIFAIKKILNNVNLK